MFRTVTFLVSFLTIAYGQQQMTGPDNCNLLSQCLIQAEQYFDQYMSLVAQKAVVNPTAVPIKEYDICVANITKMQTELNSLWSQQRKFYGTCISEKAQDALVADSQVSTFAPAIATYKLNNVNQTSSTEAVQLSTCKCDQDGQISTYSNLCNKKRTTCDAIASTCSIYSPICTSYEWNWKRSNVTMRQGELNSALIIQKALCAKMLVTVPPPPTTTTAPAAAPK